MDCKAADNQIQFIYSLLQAAKRQKLALVNRVPTFEFVFQHEGQCFFVHIGYALQGIIRSHQLTVSRNDLGAPRPQFIEHSPQDEIRMQQREGADTAARLDQFVKG